jgi:hypothetical protein
MAAKEPVSDERQRILDLCARLNAVLDRGGETPGCQAVAAIMTAARYAARSGMPPQVAAAMIADYIGRGEPV